MCITVTYRIVILYVKPKYKTSFSLEVLKERKAKQLATLYELRAPLEGDGASLAATVIMMRI